MSKWIPKIEVVGECTVGGRKEEIVRCHPFGTSSRANIEKSIADRRAWIEKNKYTPFSWAIREHDSNKESVHGYNRTLEVAIKKAEEAAFDGYFHYYHIMIHDIRKVGNGPAYIENYHEINHPDEPNYN